MPAPEVLIVGVYALGLLAVAAGLDVMAKHTQVRSERYRTAGFRYQPQHDAWICPQDEMLWPVAYDAEQHLVRYRAKPVVCNACPIKADCTDSEHGRELTRALAPWPHSEAGRFHRGVSLTLVGVAAILLLATAARHPDPTSLVLLAPLALTGWVGTRLGAHFRTTPANFPTPTPASGLRVTRPSRTRWGSDAWRTSD